MSDKGYSLEQLSHCKICRISHSDGKSHVYTKRHRESLNKILSKFQAKIKESTSSIKHPIIEENVQTAANTMWCYCCECEVQKHATENSVTILHSSTLEHLRSLKHLRKVKSFWWQNRIDRIKLDDYIVKDEAYSDFRINVLKAIDDFKRRKEQLKKQEVLRIVSVEDMRKELLHGGSGEEVGYYAVLRLLDDQSGTNNLGFNIHMASTSANSKPNVKGNIFTGMTPPWLQKEEASTSSTEIGPNLDDFQKHLELVRKSKLPAKRVGANFDRDSTKSANWLPAFGRVWNNGRRSASKQEFQQRQRKRPRTESTAPSGYSPHLPHHRSVSGPAPNINKYIL